MRPASQRAWLPFALAGLVLIGYPWVLAANHSDVEDAGFWVAAVRDSDAGAMFQPGNLLFAVPNWLIYQAAQSVGFGGDPALPMQLASVLAASASMFLVVRLGQHLGLDDFHVLIAAGLTATAFGFWRYGTEADPRVLPIPFVLLCAVLLVYLAKGNFALWQFAALGGCAALAALLDRQHLLLLPILAVVVWGVWNRRFGEISGAKLGRGLAVYGGAAVVLVVAAYALVAMRAHGCGSLGDCIAWSLQAADEGPVARAAPVEAIAGAGRAVCGLHFLYGFEGFADAVARDFPQKFLVDNRFLAEHIPPAIRWLCLGTFAVVLFAGLVVVAGCVWPRRWVAWRRPPCDTSMLRNPHCFAFGVFTLLTALVYLLANVLWLPPGIGRWIVLIPLAALLAAMRLAGWPRGRWASWAAVVLVAAMYLTNLCGSILPQASHRGDYWYKANEYLIREAKPDDLLLTDGGWLSDNCLRANTWARVLVIREHRPEEIAAAVSGHTGGRILVSSWAEEPDRRLLAATADWRRDEEALAPLFASFRGRLKRLDDNGFQVVWELVRE